MPRTSVLVVDGFMDEPSCLRIRRAMDAGTPEVAEILGQAIGADEQVRRASHVEVDEATLRFIEERLDSARDAIERFFGTSLTTREGASLLRYTPGGFFKPHRDWGEVPSWPDAARRRVAAIVFLSTSHEADPAGTFSGGALRLFPDDTAAVEILSRAGTLVAFPATMLHEVTPVREGIRDAVVDWYY